MGQRGKRIRFAPAAGMSARITKPKAMEGVKGTITIRRRRRRRSELIKRQQT